MLLMVGRRPHGNPCSFICAVNTSAANTSAANKSAVFRVRCWICTSSSRSCSGICHLIDVSMNSVGGLIEDYKRKVASVVCVGRPCTTPWLINVHLYLASTSGPSRSVSWAGICITAPSCRYELGINMAVAHSPSLGSVWQVVSPVLGSRML